MILLPLAITSAKSKPLEKPLKQIAKRHDEQARKAMALYAELCGLKNKNEAGIRPVRPHDISRPPEPAQPDPTRLDGWSPPNLERWSALPTRLAHMPARPSILLLGIYDTICCVLLDTNLTYTNIYNYTNKYYYANM